jgi:hypothetical protein
MEHKKRPREPEVEEPHDEKKETEQKLKPEATNLLNAAFQHLADLQARKEATLAAEEKKATQKWRDHRKLHRLPLHALLRRFLLLNELEPGSWPVYYLLCTVRLSEKFMNTPLLSDFMREYEALYQEVFAYHQPELSSRAGLPGDVRDFQLVMHGSGFADLFNNVYTQRMPPGFAHKYPLLRVSEPVVEMPDMVAKIQERRALYLNAWDTPQHPSHAREQARRFTPNCDPCPDFFEWTSVARVLWSHQVHREGGYIEWSVALENAAERMKKALAALQRDVALHYDSKKTTVQVAKLFTEFLAPYAARVQSHAYIAQEHHDSLIALLREAPRPSDDAAEVGDALADIHSLVGRHLGTLTQKVTGARGAPEVKLPDVIDSGDAAAAAVFEMQTISAEYFAKQVSAPFGSWLRQNTDASLHPLMQELREELELLESLYAPGEYREKMMGAYAYMKGALNHETTRRMVDTRYPELKEDLNAWNMLMAASSLTHHWGTTLRTWLEEKAGAEHMTAAGLWTSFLTHLESKSAESNIAEAHDRTVATFQHIIAKHFQQVHTRVTTSAEAQVVPRCYLSIKQILEYHGKCRDYKRPIKLAYVHHPPERLARIVVDFLEEKGRFVKWMCPKLAPMADCAARMITLNSGSNDPLVQKHIAVLVAFVRTTTGTDVLKVPFFLASVFSLLVLLQAS